MFAKKRNQARPVPCNPYTQSSLSNFGIPLLVPYTKDFERITQF